MTRINTNIAANQAVRNLQGSNRGLNRTLERLSTGYKINRASDGPAALVISERLRSQVAGLKQAVENSERSANILRTAEASMVEVARLLVGIQDLILEAGNDGAVSPEEILANQAQVDSAVETINRIANTSSFGDIHLLDGSMDYVTSGLRRGNFSEVKLHATQIGGAQSSLSVTVKVTRNASQAVVAATQAGAGLSGALLLVAGNKGTQVLTFARSAANSAIRAAVNSVADSTGVQAILSGGTTYFRSEFYGSDQYVQISDLRNLSSTTQYLNARDKGGDLLATVNGQSVDSLGLTIRAKTLSLDAELTLSANFFTALSSGSVSAITRFTITEGGFGFQLGNGSTDREKGFLGLQRMTADNLGDRSVGFLNDIVTGGRFTLTTDPLQAVQIVERAIDDVSSSRARLGAFESNTLDSNINSLGDAIQNLTASESRIRDTDFASETSEFTRMQILVQAGVSVLAQANLSPQAVLQLLS